MPTSALADSWRLMKNADVATRSRKRGRKFSIGVQLYRQAFRLGNATAAYNLGCSYQNVGDYGAAVRWFKRSLAAGDTGALVPLAQAELFGVGTRRDVPAAMTKLRRIARGGRAFSQFDQEQAMVTIAWILREGWLARRDYRGAVRWLRQAAELGSAEARGLLEDLDELEH